ncbi:hypothetical protein SacN8_09220 [Sulfolobus acidocaldarius N8]|uniref:Uncharacterized protein n=2 Tax=Sulfolobus acidocaldarius TaxID=2285 RepID=M1JEL5_9CREN|nr:hypothetical protein SacN8_09220 [Sulfolobus acidocaldarius N8]AGE74075.1 hypothetical protein SacRon12I_09240 [Sulfolobus acidocaldarius Ron12/I]
MSGLLKYNTNILEESRNATEITKKLGDKLLTKCMFKGKKESAEKNQKK